MAFINTLYNLWPNGDTMIPGLRDGIAKAAPIVFPKYEINSNLLIAHLMAQITLECGGGTEVVENLNYCRRAYLRRYQNNIEHQHCPRLARNLRFSLPQCHRCGYIEAPGGAWWRTMAPFWLRRYQNNIEHQHCPRLARNLRFKDHREFPHRVQALL